MARLDFKSSEGSISIPRGFDSRSLPPLPFGIVTPMTTAADLLVTRVGHIATVSLNRPPHNYLDAALVGKLADALMELDHDSNYRAIVLTSQGKSFCAGADFLSGPELTAREGIERFYSQALRLFEIQTPIVAAVQGPAIGAGLGLALVADFRVVCDETTFSANFNRLGIHPGFGLTYTLPALIGVQKASLLFFTGRRVKGPEAVTLNLADELVQQRDIVRHAQALAHEISLSAPLAVLTTRRSVRGDFAQKVRAMNEQERELQIEQFKSEDFREGVAAMSERRPPAFRGR